MGRETAGGAGEGEVTGEGDVTGGTVVADFKRCVSLCGGGSRGDGAAMVGPTSKSLGGARSGKGGSGEGEEGGGMKDKIER